MLHRATNKKVSNPEEQERQEVIGGDQREGIMGLLEYQAVPSFRVQREGIMGLLEYQAVPSLRDVAHDGWLCTFTL
jgi:hypothetical protein